MVDIDKLRKKIDLIDNDILKLLNKRSVIATKIGKIKKKHGKSKKKRGKSKKFT